MLLIAQLGPSSFEVDNCLVHCVEILLQSPSSLTMNSSVGHGQLTRWEDFTSCTFSITAISKNVNSPSLSFTKQRCWLPAQKQLSSSVCPGHYRACASVVLVLAKCLILDCCVSYYEFKMSALHGLFTNSPVLNFLHI